MDFSKISAKKKENLPINPIEIFHGVKVSDPGINDLWLAQGDALREWHTNRTLHDIGVVLNTGAGKTLVGLLMAQSLVNETRSQVLYACSSIQLVEQTAEKATGYGLDVCTYFGGKFSNDLFHKGLAPCVTTYQALFNGYSKFFHEDIVAVIFDDSHAAGHLLRDHYSLGISKKDFPNPYAELVELFREYHRDIGRATSYQELEDNNSGRLFFIPPFVIKSQFNELQRILVGSGLSISPNTKFAWEHIKDHIDLCCLLITPSSITITPPVVPAQKLPYFQRSTRRIYLSATLGASDTFARTFGKSPDILVSPETTAGECERMILMPSRLGYCDDDIQAAKQLLADRKVLVMVPTYRRAKKWGDFAQPPSREEVTAVVNEFKASRTPAKLLLAARYDGVDLPGDTCRIMVIDDLPTGVGPLERYFWEQLKLSNTLRTSIASRIVQSFGRISRGMSDHGVVILTSERLVQWLSIPKNSAILPPFLQKQLLLGYDISDQAESVSDYATALDQILNRDDGWISAYDDFLANAEIDHRSDDIEALTMLAENEALFATKMWDRDFEGAVRALRDSLEAAFSTSSNTGAWHALWLGYAYSLTGDQKSAEELYRRAHSAQRNIPPVAGSNIGVESVTYPDQVINVERLFTVNSGSQLGLPRSINTGLTYLNGIGTSKQTEESIRVLGELLGMNATRPDNEHGTGPDVLWCLDGFPALCIEVKSNKEPNSQYQKKEVGQLGDHVQWVKNNSPATEIIPVFIGSVNSATGTSNPPDNFLVMSLDQLQKLSERVLAALNDIARTALPLSLTATTNEIMQSRGLVWPECFRSLDMNQLRELQFRN